MEQTKGRRRSEEATRQRSDVLVSCLRNFSADNCRHCAGASRYLEREYIYYTTLESGNNMNAFLERRKLYGPIFTVYMIN